MKKKKTKTPSIVDVSLNAYQLAIIVECIDEFVKSKKKTKIFKSKKAHLTTMATDLFEACKHCMEHDAANGFFK